MQYADEAVIFNYVVVTKQASEAVKQRAFIQKEGGLNVGLVTNFFGQFMSCFSSVLPGLC